MPEDFERLLAGAKEGEPAAWAGLYEQVSGPVHGYLRAQHLTDPDDVAGEVLLQVVRDINRFTGDARAFRSWALTIAHHRTVDAARRRDRRPEVPFAPSDLPDHASPGPSSLPDADAAVLDLLTDLTEDQRTVVLLRLIGDLSVDEVARAMGRRPGAVRSLQNRAVTAMRARVRARQMPEAP